MKKFKYCEPKEMTKKELKDWIEWATEEVGEYNQLLRTLYKELSKRK